MSDNNLQKSGVELLSGGLMSQNCQLNKLRFEIQMFLYVDLMHKVWLLKSNKLMNVIILYMSYEVENNDKIIRLSNLINIFLYYCIDNSLHLTWQDQTLNRSTQKTLITYLNKWKVCHMAGVMRSGVLFLLVFWLVINSNKHIIDPEIHPNCGIIFILQWVLSSNPSLTNYLFINQKPEPMRKCLSGKKV